MYILLMCISGIFLLNKNFRNPALERKGTYFLHDMQQFEKNVALSFGISITSA